MIRQVADFSGVEILSFCVMNNHFHVLVSVPVIGSVSDEELIRRYRVLYPKPTKFQTASIDVIAKELRRNGKDAETIRSRLLARMGDVSAFMKTLKQRFSTWFNKSHERYGPLWADRFKSILVEGQGNVLQTMAAYIDLNPVRAGLVKDPKDYRFCSYAEAVAGLKDALRGLKFVTAGNYACSDSEALNLYRQMLFGKGAQPVEGRGQVSREAAAKVLNEQQGQLPMAVLLRCRIRFFTEGAVIGSKDFVHTQCKHWTASKGRKHPPKPERVQTNDFGGIDVLKNVRGSAFS
jgi:REP element-mobilizing transposase RayT